MLYFVVLISLFKTTRIVSTTFIERVVEVITIFGFFREIVDILENLISVVH